jgi:hypothetical protein
MSYPQIDNLLCCDEIAENVAAISLDQTLSEIARTVAVAGNVLPDTSVIMSLLPFVGIGETLMGDALTANTDGTISVNADVGILDVNLIIKGAYSASDVLTVGVGIGDPTALPTLAGVNPDAATYVSRFSTSIRGEGSSRMQTLSIGSFIIGRGQIVGAKAGDKLFPVLWADQTGAISVICKDVIFAVKCLKQSVS